MKNKEQEIMTKENKEEEEAIIEINGRKYYSIDFFNSKEFIKRLEKLKYVAKR